MHFVTESLEEENFFELIHKTSYPETNKIFFSLSFNDINSTGILLLSSSIIIFQTSYQRLALEQLITIDIDV